MTARNIYHKGEDWTISLNLYEDDANGVPQPFSSSGATFKMAIVPLSRASLALGPVAATATATGCSGTFPADTTAAVAAGSYRVQVQAIVSGMKSSWSDSTIEVVKGNIA